MLLVMRKITRALIKNLSIDRRATTHTQVYKVYNNVI